MSSGAPVRNCLFCRIVAGAIPAALVWQSDDAIAFKDVNPKAPVHVLVVPRAHFADIGQLAGQPTTAAAVIDAIGATSQALGLTSYRTIFNTGAEASQTVFHVHAHILAGGDLMLGFGHG